MKIELVIVLILLAFSFLYSAEMLITKDLTADIGDLTLRQSPITDYSGNPCALVKINSDLVPFDKIESNLTPVKVVNKIGEVWIYLSAGDKRLYLSKNGYARLIYNIPMKLRPNTVYTMTIMGASGKAERIKNVINLVFNLNIENVIITLEGKAPITATSTIALFRLPKGKYHFTFQKEGYKTQTKDIVLQENKTVDIVMEKGESKVKFSAPGIISIQSEPEGAEVELNGQKVGTTYGTYQASHFPGKYTLTLRKELYYPVTKTFTLKPGEVMDIPKIVLKPRFGYWKLSTIPNGADVYLDDKYIGKTPLDKNKISSGEHSLKITKENYKIYQETIIIKDGDDKKFDIKLKPNFASLEINSIPVDGATVYIDGKIVGKTPYKERVMLAGTYDIRVEKELWSGSAKTIAIQPEKPQKLNFILTKNFGTLIIKANNSKIYINDKLVGVDNYKQNLKAGTYKIKATREKHYDDIKNVFVNIGETTTVELSPKPKLASISVFAIDKRNHNKKISGAEIFLNDKDSQKKTPAVIELLYGDYEIKLKHPKYLDAIKNIELKEGETKTVILEMDTYKGSILAKRNKWRWQSRIGFVFSVLIAGTGYYCNMLMNDNWENYNKAQSTSDAMYFKERTQKFQNYRDYCYYASSGIFTYTFFSWIKTIYYNAKLKSNKML